MARRNASFEIFLVALAAILLEVSYTRIFSYKLVYFFTYVVIGLALLGLGSGGVVVSMLRTTQRDVTGRRLAVLCLIGATTVGLGYLVVAQVPANAFEMIRNIGTEQNSLALWEIGKLLLISTALFIPFLSAGIVIATIFVAHPDRIGRLYFADLVGAGIGCGLCVPLMILLTPPGCVLFAGACFAVAGIRVAVTQVRGLVVPLGVVAVVLFLGAVAGTPYLPEIIVDNTKNMNPKDRPPILFSQWSPVFRVDVLVSPLFARDGHALVHDGMWGSVLPWVDGNPEALTRLESNPRALPFAVARPNPKITIIGSAGGIEILAALHFNAAHVTGIELNPITLSLLRTQFKDFTGRFADDPRVTLINAEGRSYLEGTDARSDMVWFVAPDSYAAMNAATSGAYVLSESYLYTAEMLEAAFAHLEPGGIVCAQFGEIAYPDKPNRTTRYLTTAREAFRRLGIHDFANHVMVATSSGFVFTTSTILLRREPFTAADAERLAAKGPSTSSQMRFGGRWSEPEHPVTAVITLAPDALDAWYKSYQFDVRPVTDDKPFFWHFLPFRETLHYRWARGPAATEEGLGERLLLLLLALVTLFAAVTLLAPLLLRRTLWRTIPHKLAAGIYFAALGIGFMCFEVTMIQHFTLFLGYPTYSLTVTLFALLLSTGLGSLLSERVLATRDRTIMMVGGLLALLVVAYVAGLGPLTARAVAAPFPARVILAVIVLLPLGLCLGLFMPLGLRSIAALTPHAPEYVAWAWAVNGFFSVVASVLATVLSMSFGFQNVMWIALMLYGVAIAALRRIPAPA
jgi:spermidine synthase